MSETPSWMTRLLATFRSGNANESWHERNPDEGLSESDRFLIDALPFERQGTSGSEVLAQWERLRVRNDLYPLIVGEEENLIRLVEQWSLGDRSPQEILDAADQLDHPGSLTALRELNIERMKQVLGQSAEEREEEPGAPAGDWPEPGKVAPDDGPAIIRDWQTGEPIGKAYLLLIPARRGFEVPAFLRWGGWNECPPPEYHVAALHSWYARYGAELVAMSGDVIELRVQRRPATRNEAMALAREHYAYCRDIVDQGAGTIANLAAGLMVSDWWYFWWD